eukprot:3036882-Prymnesium_polylepis.2
MCIRDSHRPTSPYHQPTSPHHQPTSPYRHPTSHLPSHPLALPPTSQLALPPSHRPPRRYAAASRLGAVALATQIADSIRANDLNRLSLLLARSPAQALDGALLPQQPPPLHIAAGCAAVDALVLLLQRGASPHTTDSEGRTALMVALEGAHSDCAAELLQAPCDVAARCAAGQPTLHKAALRGLGACVALLIDKRAPVDAADHHGRTALHAACVSGEPVVALNLLSAADALGLPKASYLDLPDAYGCTPALLAARVAYSTKPPNVRRSQPDAPRCRYGSHGVGVSRVHVTRQRCALHSLRGTGARAPRVRLPNLACTHPQYGRRPHSSSASPSASTAARPPPPRRLPTAAPSSSSSPPSAPPTSSPSSSSSRARRPTRRAHAGRRRYTWRPRTASRMPSAFCSRTARGPTCATPTGRRPSTTRCAASAAHPQGGGTPTATRCSCATSCGRASIVGGVRRAAGQSLCAPSYSYGFITVH